MLRLIGTPKARTLRVMWMLEELEEPYDLDPAPPHGEAILAVNPSGKVPALVVDGTVLTESVAICQFLADRAGRLTFPAGTIERAKQDSMTFFAADDLDGILWHSAKHSFVLPEELRSSEVRRACEHDLARSVAALEQRLGDGEYAMGDTFTVPDILIGHCASWAINAKFGWPEGKLTDYVNRLWARPAYQRAHEIRKAS